MNENIFVYALSFFCIILIFTIFIKRKINGIKHLVIFSLYTLPLYYLMFFKGAGGAAFTWCFYLFIATIVHILSLAIIIFRTYKKKS